MSALCGENSVDAVIQLVLMLCPILPSFSSSNSLAVFLGTVVFNLIHPGQFLPRLPEAGTHNAKISSDTMRESIPREGSQDRLITGERLA